MKLHVPLLAAFGLLAPLSFTANAAELTLDEVLAKHYEARGGLDTIRAVNSMRSSGDFTMGPVQGPFQIESVRPGKMRLEFTVQGMTAVQVVDGDSGWQIMPFMGKTDPEPMTDEDLRNFQNQADIDGPLVDWQQKGHKVELLGTEEVEGADAYKLKINLKSGDEILAYLDSEYFLDLKWDMTTTMRGQPIKVSTSFGDYKEVDGLTVPHVLTQTMEGMPGGQTFTIKTYEVNVPVDDARFAMPAKAPAAGTPAAE
jgi:outer membrane lipoprotein-sorting protein